MAESELALVNKVDLKIALANTDGQLEHSLNIYLLPLLLKLSSPHGEVRQAIFKIIQNVMTRMTAARTIKLPAQALLQQVKNPKVPIGTDASNVRLYSLLFISKSIERMNDDEKRDFIPQVLNGLSTFPANVGARMFSIFCKLITGWKAPEFESMDYYGLIKDLDFESHPQDEIYICEKIAKFLMLQPFESANPIQLPGLSVSDVSFFTKDAGISFKTNGELLVVKKQLLEFLKVGFKTPNLRIPLLIASTDSSSSINDTSEILYKKLDVNLEDEQYINSLIVLFIGDKSLNVPPVTPVLQEKILSQLIKSVIATKHPNILEITNLGLMSDYAKLKQSTVQFIKWVSSNNKEALKSINETMDMFNNNMARRLKENILNEGWPQPVIENGRSYSAVINQRLSQYEALSNILKTYPELALNDFSYIEFLFESLECESVDLRSTLQEGLSSLTSFLPRLSRESQLNLKVLAHKYLGGINFENDNIHACRFIILKFINCTFPFDDCESRYLNILGTAKVNRPETIEEANKGLHPHWFNINQSSNSTEFKSTAELLGGGNKPIKFPRFEGLVYQLKNMLETNGKDPNYMIYKSMNKAIEFSIQSLVMQAVEGKQTVIVSDEEWAVRLEKAVEVDNTVRKYLKNEICSIYEQDGNPSAGNPFNLFLSIIYDAFEGQFDSQSAVTHSTTYESTFVKLLSLSTSKIVGHLSYLIDPFLRILNERTLHDISISQISNIIGIIASHPVNSDETLSNLLTELIKADLPPHKSKANLLTTAYLLSRLALRQRIDRIVTKDMVQRYCQKLLVALKDTSSYYQAIECVGQLALYGILGPELTLVDSNFILEVVELLNPKVKKCDERSVLIMSYLTVSITHQYQGHEQEMTIYEQMVYDTHISKQTEYLFTSGEAMLILAIGWHSKVLQRAIDIQDETLVYVPSNTERFSFILDLVLTACSNTKPSLRRAGCIWLLSLVEFCDSMPLIKDQSAKIHVTFMKFLADRDELVQEAASRGLSLVYELGDVELKENLVKGLLKSFTDTNSTTKLISGTVEEDTELFETGLLKTHEGSVSTYRDVLNLASDVGDPSLVYKFMSMAKSSALWSSRKGMAFGLGSILSKTSLDNMLKNNKPLADRLIPKLYRYRYDPSTSVSNSMNEIWNVLVEDSSKTINENFDIILQELLKSMGNKEWRVRQASTTALNDLLNVVEFEVYQGKLEDIWNMSFRVMDDIKESVRQEANKVTKLLSNLLTKSNKTGGGLDRLVPFLLGNKGLLSDAEDIRNFALDTILKLIKSDNKELKPYIPTLLENFIGMMSTLEPEVINYLILNADKYNVKNNDIDAKRLQSLGHSPMMDAIEKLIDKLDYEIIDPSITVIISCIKKSIGLPSKVSGSKVLVSLVTKKYELIKPYGDKLFKAAVNQVYDKNDTIASSYSVAVGYLSRLTSIELIVNYGKKLKTLYFETDEERNRLISGIASENFSKYSNEKFDSVASEFLPLTFIGMNDIDKEVAKVFERQWIENTSGSNVLKLYLNEIIELMSSHIKSPNYQIRQNLAKSIVKLTNDINDFNNFSDQVIRNIFDILLESCKGKSWSGKELIFEALVNYSIKLKNLLNDDESLLESINKIVLTESKRRNKDYQRHSIKIAGKYLYHFPTDELFEVYLETMELIVNDKYDDDDDDDVNDGDNQDIDMTRSERSNGKRSTKRLNNNANNKLEDEKLVYIKTVCETFNIKWANKGLFDMINDSLMKLLNDQNKFEITWRSKICSNECFERIITELGDTEYEIDALFKLWNKLNDRCSDFNNIENVKIKFIRNSKLFISYLENLHHLELVTEINKQLEKFNSDSTIIRAELMKN